MTVDIFFQLSALNAFATVATPGDGDDVGQPDVAALSNGSFAELVQDDAGYADLYIYNAAGVITGKNINFDATDAKLTQLSNGNILVTGTVANNVDYRIFDQSGNVVDAGPVGRGGGFSNVSVTAMANGAWATAEQLTFSSFNHDIEVFIHPAGSGQSSFRDLDNTTANDQNPSIATLSDGGLAIAWDRTDSSGNTSIYEEILNADGSVRIAEKEIDNVGSINRQPDVIALANGGFYVSYEDNGWDNTQSDITGEIYDASGNLVQAYRLSTATAPDSQAVSAQLSNGYIVTAYTEVALGADTDILLSVVDPNQPDPLETSVIVTNTNDIESLTSITAMANGQVAITYLDSTTQTAKVGIFSIARDIDGDAADNVLTGDRLQDGIYAEGGNDTITPGDGAGNYVDGGAGYDTVIFSGARAGYIFQHAGLTTIVTRPDGGTDTLTNVEKLQFSNGNYYTLPAPRDLYGKGHSDMVLQSTSGAVKVWEINSNGTLAASNPTSTTPSSAYTVVGTGQFTFAADNDADILLQNTNGTMVVWEMAGATVAATASLGSLSNVWKALTTGDFNGDGNADILLQNTSTGQLDIWLMNGTTAITKATVGGAIGTSWHAVATADFNGDGKSDIVLQNTGGQIDIWTMNGVTPSTAALSGTAGSGWIVRSAGDFNGDGKADLLLQNAAGQVAVWTMNGATVTAKTVVGTVATSFTVTGTGDFNGDGKADIVFQSSSGAVSEWLMNGDTVTTKLNLGNAGTGWHMVAGTGG